MTTINVRVSPEDVKKIDRLKRKYGTRSNFFRMAMADKFEQESGEKVLLPANTTNGLYSHGNY